MSALLLLALLASPFVQQPNVGADGDELVRLRDGRLLVGVVEEHDLDGLQLGLARSGGRLRLAWNDLFPGEAERLRAHFGYVIEVSVPTTTAHRVLLQNGKEVIGRILRQDAGGIEVRTLDATVLIPPRMVAAPPEEIVVDAATVLTPEQFYAERLPAIAADDGYAQFLFAQELEQMFALDRAKERYSASRVLAAGDNDQPLITRIDGALKHLDGLILNQAEAAALEAIRRGMYREKFEEAEAGLIAFASDFPQPRLRDEFNKLRGVFQSEREKAITRYLARNWYVRAMDEIKRKALERDAGVDQLLAWVESELPMRIRQRLVAELEGMDDELDPTRLDALWLRRTEHNVTRHRASFGAGTWILGEERARMGMATNKPEEKEDGKSAAQKEMEERVQRYLKTLEAQRRAASGGADEGEATPDDWWRVATVTERAQFLLAYYAEYTGDFQATSFEFKACPTCAGSGVIESIETGAQGSQNKRLRCP
ncbi:MAG: hypothetical protein O3A20_06920, partial [Planctomycetota bacterium]|nr:hypothetical protein [Planctomycetota bacterium]